MKHPAHDILVAVANGEVIEATSSSGKWEPVPANILLARLSSGAHPEWFRVKPKTLKIGGMEFPEPMRAAPEPGTVYWVCNDLLGNPDAVIWENDSTDLTWLSKGVCQSTEAGAEAQLAATLAVYKGAS